jgi:hypothetical protein
VAAATATGVLLSSNKTGVSCDVNSSTDQSVPTEVFTPPSFGDLGFPVVDGSEIAPVEIPTSDPGVVDTGFGGGGLGGGTGGGSGPGGSAGAGPTEPEENPNDGGDPEPVGPMATCPVAGGAPGLPPGGICVGATVTRIIGNIGDEGNAIRETGGTELYSLPFTPPEPLGGDDYNGKFVVYEWECPDGSKQRSDPCEEPEQEPDPNGDFTPNENILFTTNIAATYVITDCISGATEDRGGDSSGTVTLFAGSSYKVEGYGISRTFEKRCTEAIPGPIGIPGATVTGPAGLVESVGGVVILPGGKDITFSRIINYTTANVNGDPVDLNDFRDP